MRLLAIMSRFLGPRRHMRMSSLAVVLGNSYNNDNSRSSLVGGLYCLGPMALAGSSHCEAAILVLSRMVNCPA
jgi:hypothetical protein